MAELRMKAIFPVESGRGAECPYCGDEDFMSRGIQVSAKNQKLVVTETCSKCGQEWDEQTGLGIVKNEATQKMPWYMRPWRWLARFACAK